LPFYLYFTIFIFCWKNNHERAVKFIHFINVHFISGALRVEEIIKKYGTVDVIFQAVMCIWDVLNMDERIQVNGFLLLHDGTMSDTDTAKSYNISTMKRCMHIYQVRILPVLLDLLVPSSLSFYKT
jgi:hypothetical protein